MWVKWEVFSDPAMCGGCPKARGMVDEEVSGCETPPFLLGKVQERYVPIHAKPQHALREGSLRSTAPRQWEALKLRL